MLLVERSLHAEFKVYKLRTKGDQTMAKLEPLKLENLLAGNPKDPNYALELQTKCGGTYKVSDPRAIRAMVALMDMQAVMGGAASHWGGPAALSEIWSALHAFVFTTAQKASKPWHEMFHVINDAGHCENALYAIKANYGFADLTVDSLKGFRSISSPLTGHGESHLFPMGVFLSNGPLGSSLPQSQGLAYADALSGNTRVTVTTISDGACMEGEAKEALAAIPGMAQRGKLSPFVLIVSDNNTKLSGRIDEEAFSMAPTFASLKDLGWQVLELEKGNDLQSSLDCIEKAVELAQKNPAQPVCIHAKTVKGFGVKSTAESSSGGHGFPLKKPEELQEFLAEIYGGESVPEEFTTWQKQMVEEAQSKTKSAKSSDVVIEKVQVGVSQALCAAAEKGLPVVSVSADLAGSTGVAGFQKKFPEHSYDVGVAESNMVSVGAGLSKSGFIPVVDTFSQFGVTKGALPFLMANLSEAPMIAIFSHAGFQDAADGASHQALTYFAMAGSVPNTEVYALSTSAEAEALVGQAVEQFAVDRKTGKTPKTYIFFLGRETFPQTVNAKLGYKLGEAQVVADTTDSTSNSVTLVSCGPLLHQALKAAEVLKEKGIGSFVVNASSINQPDTKTLTKCLQKTEGRMVTVEDHQKIGGMASMLTQALTEEGVPLKLKALGVDGEYGQSAYMALELYEKHGLDAASITETAEEFFK
jgi:transketolase